MNNIIIEKTTLNFLKNLSSNNNRNWFNRNKATYELAKENAECFMDALIRKMNTHDQLETSEVNRSFKSIRPFFDYMSEVLTTNANGEPLKFPSDFPK